MGHHNQFPNKGIGYGIFYLMLLFLPVIGKIFGFLNWMIEHIEWILLWLVVIILISMFTWFALDDEKEMEDEEENV